MEALSQVMTSRTYSRAKSATIWPLRTEADYARAAQVVDRLALEPEGSLSRADQDRLEIFTDLIAAYEDRHGHRVDTASVKPLDMVQFYMEQRGMTPSDLGRVLGDRSLGGKILRGERQLSKTHIRKLAAFFHCSTDAFLSPIL